MMKTQASSWIERIAVVLGRENVLDAFHRPRARARSKWLGPRWNGTQRISFPPEASTRAHSANDRRKSGMCSMTSSETNRVEAIRRKAQVRQVFASDPGAILSAGGVPSRRYSLPTVTGIPPHQAHRYSGPTCSVR